MTALFWFTNDLRVNDNPGLAAAGRDYDHVLPLYVLDASDPWAPGGASRWWLHNSLTSLQQAIAAQGGRLLLRRGPLVNTVIQLVERAGVQAVYFSRAYEPWLATAQQTLFERLEAKGIHCKRFGSRLLLEPEQVLNKQGKPFQVFTPFYKEVLKTCSFSRPAGTAEPKWLKPDGLETEDIKAWQLLPRQPDWAAPFTELWQPGEAGARATLAACVEDVIERYDKGRDFPAQECTSRLSPALHFGELSPRQVWHAVESQSTVAYEAYQPLLRQLIWREFSHYLLHHWPHMPEKPFKQKFTNFPWDKNPAGLSAWQTGQTGYPIVDAGMRELWQTGWMHNRVRMITASFLTKHLRVHWLTGAQWFWDTLLDADLANNSAGWQWVAGSGADAAPYFRIFNPTLQGEKFDKRGEYVRRWVPELAQLPNKYIHTPWLAPPALQQSAGVQIGRDYPAPIVNHQQAREQALHAYRMTS